MTYNHPVWTVGFAHITQKQANKLTHQAKAALRLLVEDLKRNGPAPGIGWPNYGKLKSKNNEDLRHCHLIKGRPTYVCAVGQFLTRARD